MSSISHSIGIGVERSSSNSSIWCVSYAKTKAVGRTQLSGLPLTADGIAHTLDVFFFQNGGPFM